MSADNHMSYISQSHDMIQCELTSATLSSPIFAARQSGVSPPASRADMSALKTLTRARRRGREGRPVGSEKGREGGRERAREIK